MEQSEIIPKSRFHECYIARYQIYCTVLQCILLRCIALHWNMLYDVVSYCIRPILHCCVLGLILHNVKTPFPIVKPCHR